MFWASSHLIFRTARGTITVLVHTWGNRGIESRVMWPGGGCFQLKPRSARLHNSLGSTLGWLEVTDARSDGRPQENRFAQCRISPSLSYCPHLSPGGWGTEIHGPCPYVSQLDCMAEMERGAEGLKQAEASARRWHLAFWLFNARKKHFSFYRITSEEISSPGVSQPLVNLLGVLVGFVLNVLDL